MASCGVHKALRPPTTNIDVKAGFWEEDTLKNIRFVLTNKYDKKVIDTTDIDPDDLACHLFVGIHKDTLESFTRIYGSQIISLKKKYDLLDNKIYGLYTAIGEGRNAQNEGTQRNNIGLKSADDMTPEDLNNFSQSLDQNRLNDQKKFAYLTDYAKMTDTLLIEQKKLSQAFLFLLTEHLSLSGILSDGEVPIDMRDTQIQYMFDPTYTSAIFEQTISVQKTPDTTTYTIDMTYFTHLCNRFANRMVQYQPDEIIKKMPTFVQTMSAFHKNKQNIGYDKPNPQALDALLTQIDELCGSGCADRENPLDISAKPKDALQITYHQDNKTEIVYSCKPTQQHTYHELKPYIEDLSQREKDPNMLDSCLPFNGGFIMNECGQPMTVYIYNLMGKKVLQMNMANRQVFDLQNSTLPAGVYFAKGDDGQYNYKATKIVKK